MLARTDGQSTGRQLRIILSRKGFDSAGGGVPSPIVNGEPISLPIPTAKRSETTYELAGLGDIVARTTKGRVRRGVIENAMVSGTKAVLTFEQNTQCQQDVLYIQGCYPNSLEDFAFVSLGPTNRTPAL